MERAENTKGKCEGRKRQNDKFSFYLYTSKYGDESENESGKKRKEELSGWLGAERDACFIFHYYKRKKNKNGEEGKRRTPYTSSIIVIKAKGTKKKDR